MSSIAEVHKVSRPENEQLRNDSKRQIGELLGSESHILCFSIEHLKCVVRIYLKKRRRKWQGLVTYIKRSFIVVTEQVFILFFGGSCADLCMWQNVIKLHKDY